MTCGYCGNPPICVDGITSGRYALGGGLSKQCLVEDGLALVLVHRARASVCVCVCVSECVCECECVWCGVCVRWRGSGGRREISAYVIYV